MLLSSSLLIEMPRKVVTVYPESALLEMPKNGIDARQPFTLSFPFSQASPFLMKNISKPLARNRRSGYDFVKGGKKWENCF